MHASRAPRVERKQPRPFGSRKRDLERTTPAAAEKAPRDDDGTREGGSRGRKIGRTERARGRACVPRRTRVRRARVVAFVVS